MMIKVLKKKGIQAYPSLQDDTPYYLDTYSLSIPEDSLTVEAELWLTAKKEGRIGYVPVEWFERSFT